MKKNPGFFWTVGYVLAPVYVEFVKWVDSKTDLPVKVALRDGGPIYDTAIRMADRLPKEWGHLKSWDAVHLNRWLVYRLGRDWQHRSQRFYRHDQKRFYNMQREILLEKYIPEHGLDKPFAFVDTGIQGRMSRILNGIDIKNTPLFMVSESKADSLDYPIDSMCDMLEPFLKRSSFYHRRLFLGLTSRALMMGVLDSIPQRTEPVFALRDDASTFAMQSNPRYVMFRDRFDRGLFYGIDEYLDNPPRKEPMKDVTKCVISEWTRIMIILNEFMDARDLNFSMGKKYGIDMAKKSREHIFEYHNIIYGGKGR